MQTAALILNDPLVHRLSQLLYRCLEDLGSTKAALYLAIPGTSGFELASHYGWPRVAPPPQHLDPTDPLLLLVQRQRRSFVLNDGAAYPELQPFGQGKQDPHYFISPIFDHGEWTGLLLQRDPNRGEVFSLERQEAPTHAICQEIVQAIKYAASRPEPALSPPANLQAAAQARQQEVIRVPAPPTFPEQQRFFWEAATMLCRMVPTAAVALWTYHPVENRPILTYSLLPLAPQLEQEVIAHAIAHLPFRPGPELRILAKAEYFDQEPIQGPFHTLMPILLEEQFGDPDLLIIFRVEDRPFQAQELEFIGGLARMLGLYLEEGRLHERYHQSFLSVSHRILATAGEKVPAIRAQSVNTAELSRTLARRLGRSSSEVEAVTISAILHDVGTLLLDRRILDKPILSAEDQEKMQAHPILASTFLKDFHFPFDVLRIIRHHHEQWDGKGYPDGISGDAIPIESRIIHLVESFQVMTTGTAYRPAKPLSTALEEIRELSGSHFDPQMVEEFIKLLESRDGPFAAGNISAPPGTL